MLVSRRHLSKLGAILMLGLAFWLGRWSADTNENPASTTEDRALVVATTPADQAERPHPNIPVDADPDIDSVEPGATTERNPFAFLSERVGTRNIRPILSFLIGQMNDEDLIDIIQQTTNLPESDARNIRDVQRYADRLSSIALAGVLFDERRDDDGASDRSGEIAFSETAVSDSASTLAPEDGSSGQRIYADFETGNRRTERVFVRWVEAESSRVMMFRSYPIDPDSRRHYVWVEPDESWAPGEYAVEVFSADEELLELAKGRYEIPTRR